MSTAIMYVCLEDPTGIYTDSEFTQGAFHDSLEAGNWPPKSVWKNKRTGQKYRVDGNECWHHLLDVGVKVPDHVREGQRKVRVR
jgi:hypothetical protein